MKTLQKIALALVIVVFSSAALNAQSYKHEVKGSKRVIIDNLLGEMSFEGYNGNEIIVEVDGFDALPKRADGLRAIYGGSQDNSGVGLFFREFEGNIEISGASKQSEDATYTFKIPNSMSIKVDCSSPFTETDNLVFKNFSSEITVKTMDANIEFVNVTGPITGNSIDGDIVVAFADVNQENPISLYTIDGEIDVVLPSNTPADIKFSTIDGEIYTDFDIDFRRKGSDTGDNHRRRAMHYVGGHNSSQGTINGGGVKISLKTIDGTIYLRKK